MLTLNHSIHNHTQITLIHISYIVACLFLAVATYFEFFSSKEISFSKMLNNWGPERGDYTIAVFCTVLAFASALWLEIKEILHNNNKFEGKIFYDRKFRLICLFFSIASVFNIAFLVITGGGPISDYSGYGEVVSIQVVAWIALIFLPDLCFYSRIRKITGEASS